MFMFKKLNIFHILLKVKTFYAIINQSPFDSHQVLNIEGHKGICMVLKVHKIENFFGSDFEFCVISLFVMLKC
jgi:hypothetical protein